METKGNFKEYWLPAGSLLEKDLERVHGGPALAVCGQVYGYFQHFAVDDSEQDPVGRVPAKPQA